MLFSRRIHERSNNKRMKDKRKDPAKDEMGMREEGFMSIQGENFCLLMSACVLLIQGESCDEL